MDATTDPNRLTATRVCLDCGDPFTMADVQEMQGDIVQDSDVCGKCGAVRIQDYSLAKLDAQTHSRNASNGYVGPSLAIFKGPRKNSQVQAAITFISVGVVMCRLVNEPGRGAVVAPLPGSQTEECLECKEPVWRAPGTLGLPFPSMCVGCTKKALADNGGRWPQTGATRYA